MSPWQATFPLGALGTIITGRTPPTAQPGLFGDAHPFITPSDMDGQHRWVQPERWVSEEGADYLKRAALPENAICVVCIGATIGKVCMTKQPSFTNQQINSIIVDESRADPSFLYHLLRTLQPQFQSRAGGAATPILNKSSFSEIDVTLPSLGQQRAAGRVLTNYDALIENCERRIRVLDAIARALYREWFVLFRYPGHEKTPLVESPLGRIPNGWAIRSVKDLATVVYGFPFKSTLFSTDSSGRTPVVRIRDIPAGASSTYTSEAADPRYEIANGDILVGMDGDFHMTIWSNGRALQNQRVARFQPTAGWAALQLFLALERPIQALNTAIVGTTVAHLGDMHIRDIRIVEPPAQLLMRSRATFEPIDLEIRSLQQEVRNLRKARDLLLPRLLSGQVPLEEAA